MLFPRSINSSSNPTPRSLQYWQRVRRQRSRNWRVAEVAALLLPFETASWEPSAGLTTMGVARSPMR